MSQDDVGILLRMSRMHADMLATAWLAYSPQLVDRGWVEDTLDVCAQAMLERTDILQFNLPLEEPPIEIDAQ